MCCLRRINKRRSNFNAQKICYYSDIINTIVSPEYYLSIKFKIKKNFRFQKFRQKYLNFKAKYL